MPDPADLNPNPAAYEEPELSRPASAAPTEGELEQEAPSVAALDYSPAPPAHDPYAALRHPAYVTFSVGWMAAVIGSQMTNIALGWELYDRTKANLALTWLAVTQVIPLVFLALPAGVIADRFDRRRLIQLTAVLNALCSVGLAVFSYRPGMIVWMYACATASACVLTIGRPARSALLPNIVPKAVFPNAATWNSSIFQVSAMIGPALGGLLIATSLRWFGSLSIPYALDSASALFYALVMLRIPREAGTTHKTAGNEAAHPLEQLKAGIRFVYQTKIIFATLTLDLFAVMLGGAVYLLPVFAHEILHATPTQFGWLRAAEAIGAVCMAVFIAHAPPMRRAGRSMLLAVGMFGAATVVFGLSRNYWLSLAMMVLIGAFDNVSVVVRHTLVQVLTPDPMRGRVSAVNNVFIGASNDLGGVESTLTATLFGALCVHLGYAAEQAKALGPMMSVVVGGIGTILVVLATAWLFPQLRRYGPLQPHGPEGELAGPDPASKDRAEATSAAGA
jgi:MFS family permease